jgi:hypothetical protein
MCAPFLPKLGICPKRLFVALLSGLVLFGSMACLPGKVLDRLTGPSFVNHPRPDLSVSMHLFEEAGCTVGKYGALTCADDSPLSALPCDAFQVPSDLLGGLDPALPIATCFVYGKGSLPLPREEYFYNASAGTVDDRYPALVRYVVLDQGRFQLVKNEDAFRELYAPVDSPEEALSYVLAVKGLSAYYGLERRDRHKYFTEVIEDTHLEVVEDGYRLHLFQSNASGPSVCDPVGVSSVSVHLSFEGTIHMTDRTAMFEYIPRDPLCVN